MSLLSMKRVYPIHHIPRPDGLIVRLDNGVEYLLTQDSSGMAVVMTVWDSEANKPREGAEPRTQSKSVDGYGPVVLVYAVESDGE